MQRGNVASRLTKTNTLDRYSLIRGNEMNEIKDKELWKEICFDLCNSYSTMNEELYEQKIIMSLDKMGWKQFKGEIVLKQSIPVGSANSIIPDIIVKSRDKNISFVIEVKKPSIPLTEGNRSQLFSYMRQLKFEFGILFGERIEIFYDGELNPSSNPIKIKKIEFNNNSPNLDFVKIFKKSSLSKTNLQDYAKKRISTVNSQKEKKELIERALSPQFAAQLKEKAKDILMDNWNEEIIDAAMDDFVISIKSTVKNTEPIPPIHPQRPPGAKQPSPPYRKVEYEFHPSDEREFKSQLLQNKYAHVKIFYQDGREEYKAWNASKFTENSNLRGNINSKTWFRQDYVQRQGVVKAIFSINPL